MKVSAPTGRLAKSAATLSKRSVTGECSKTMETAPIATPITASNTTGASFKRTATGWETATTTSKVASTARSRTISIIEGYVLSGRRVEGQLGIAPSVPRHRKSDAQDE